MDGNLKERPIGERYLQAVLAHVALKTSNDRNSPSLAILAEQARADAEIKQELSWTPTRLRITKVILATALGAGVGHVADLQGSAVPDWVEVGVVATAGAATASRSRRWNQTEQQSDAVSAIADTTTYENRRLRSYLRQAVNELISIADPSLSAPPLARGQPLTASIESALELLKERASKTSEYVLKVSPTQRHALARAGDDLRKEAEATDLMRLDPICDEEINALAALIDQLTSDPLDKYDVQLRAGELFLLALKASWHVACRLESGCPMYATSSFLPEPTVKPQLQLAA